jgi:putative ABC transport system permease protein
MNWHAEINAEFARRRTAADPTVVEEMAQHAGAAYDAARAEGMTAEGAEASVRALIQSWCSATTGPRRLERPVLSPVEGPLTDGASSRRSRLAGLALDVRLALRLLWKEPGFALFSIVMIALAIASVTTLFTVIDGVLLKPPPRVNVDRLVRVFEQDWERLENMPAISNRTYHAWSNAPETIEGIGAWNEHSLSLGTPAGLELVGAAGVTASLFPLIGVSPVLGAQFNEAQELTGDAVILSYGFWQERFGGGPDALGKQLTIGGRPRTIVGVMPRGFEFPDRATRLWVPERPPQVVHRESKNSIAMTFSAHAALARLKPGVSPQQAASEAAARVRSSRPRLPGPRLPGRGRDQWGPGGPAILTLTPMLDWMVKDVKPALLSLAAAVFLLFIAAIGNVANMQLARAAARQREVAIRSAIGAGGGRLFRQLFVETSAIAAIGGCVGLGLTFALMRVLPSLMPEDFPRLQDIGIDGRVLVMATGLTMAVSIGIGLLPARLARRVKLTSALAGEGSAPAGSSLRSPTARSRTLIITGQVAIAALLLVGAGLLSNSLWKLVTIDRGYEPANLLTARLTYAAQGRQAAAARAAFFTEVLDRVTATRGVTHAGLSGELPLAPSQMTPGYGPEGTGEERDAIQLVVSTDYLAAMKMRVVRGRGFTAEDVQTSELVVLVNETFASRYLHGEPLGAVLRLEGEFDAGRGCAPTKAQKSACTQPWRVVGVVGDVTYPDGTVLPYVFAPRSQIAGMSATQYLTVRTTGDPAVLAGDLRGIVKNASREGILDQVLTMETRLMMSLARPRLYAILLGGFAMFALLIAGIGLFGGLSYAVTQRTREIGVRTALGATPRDIVALVVKQGVVMTGAGLAIGLGAAAATVRYLAAYLFGIEPLDPATFAAVGAALLLCAMVACAIPARRAARIDAIAALRS